MRILVADDESIPRMVLERTLRGWGHDIVSAADGTKAWEILRRPDAPRIAILDWMMPGLEGPEICRKVRAHHYDTGVPPYCILLTARDGLGDIVTGLDSGADDYVTKPFDREELRSRIQVGTRIVDLQQAMSERVHDLEQSLAREKRLQGLLPLCAWCKQVRNDGSYWQSVENYLTEITDGRITHCICPTCYQSQSGKPASVEVEALAS